MGFRAAVTLALCGVFLSAGGAAARGTGDLVVVALKDGSRLVGTVVAEDEATLTLRTSTGLELNVPQTDVTSRGPAPSDFDAIKRDIARAELTDPNDTRLMFAPTGRPLRKGDGYFSDHYVIFPGFAYGLNDHISVSGGVSVIPGLGLDEQLFYVSSSVGWRFKENAAFSLGGLYATGTEANEAGALLFGVGSFGHPDRSLSVGLGLAALRNEEYYTDERGYLIDTRTTWEVRDAPILMLGGTFRLAKRLSLVTESWLFLGSDFELSEQPFGLGLRFFGERLSVDVGFLLVADVIEEGFPIPWLSFSYHFGPSRKALNRRAPGPSFGPETWRAKMPPRKPSTTR